MNKNNSVYIVTLSVIAGVLCYYLAIFFGASAPWFTAILASIITVILLSIIVRA